MMLIECANGRYPFPEEGEEKKDLGFWELMECITLREAPKLDPKLFSADFCDFVSICMRKEGGTRSSANQLLQHPFCARYANVDEKNLRRWIKTTI